MSNSRGGKNRKLSTRISRIASCILIVVFSILIVFTVLSTQKSMNQAITNEFQIMAKASGQQVQQIVDTAESASTDISSYLTKAYKMSTTGKRNMLGQSFAPGESKDTVIQSRTYLSAVFGQPISELSADVEKYLVETARHVASDSEEIVGVGVLFEPDAFGGEIKDYSFYINEANAEEAVTPYGAYADYAKESYYVDAAAKKELIFTDPYEYAGKKIVTAAQPVYNGGAFQCVIRVDINLSSFEQVRNVNEKYPSMFTSIANQNRVMVYDTEDTANIGAKLDGFFSNPDELSGMKEGTASGKEFHATVRRDVQGGRITEVFFYPIQAGNSYWWSLTALEKSDMNRDTMSNAMWLAAISIAALLVVSLAIFVLLRRSLRPIDGVVQAAEKIARGDLDIHLNARSNDEIGRLSQAFDLTVTRLKEMIDDINWILGEMGDGNFNVKTRSEESYVGEFQRLLLSIRKINDNLSNTLIQISQSSTQVSGGSEQVSSGAQALSQGAAEQAGAVQALAATINDISAQVKDSARNAQEANEKAGLVGEEIRQSNEQMQKMISAMNDISQCSDQIGNIIKTIENIAFQTNILALNAAVEAARAGVAGKGFAVVADEVRSLANKSQEASKDTSALIENSLRAVENGTKIADETALSLNVVVENVKDVTETINRISEASNEQAQSIVQVTQGVEQISGVVQTNSATAQESAAASEELSGQAQLLKALVGRFRLKDMGQTEGAETLPKAGPDEFAGIDKY